MARGGVGLSKRSDPVEAVEEAVSLALSGAGACEAALLFATPAHASAMPRILEIATGSLSTRAVVGATAHGVLGSGEELEGGHGLVVAALADVEVEPFLLTDLAPEAPHVADELVARLAGGPRPEDLVVLLPDPRSVPLLAVLEDVRRQLGPAVIVGAGAADPVLEAPLQWCGRQVESGALAGVVIRGERPPQIGVTQACRPATELLTVTRARGHWILELDGRPALEVYREAVRGPLADDLRRAAGFVLAALPVAPGTGLEPGSYLVRNVAGFAVEEQALAIPSLVAQGDAIAFVVRDPQAARDDLKAMLDRVAGAMDGPSIGLYFDCCARGESLFGVSGLEAGYLGRALGDTPVAGMLGSCEIGPVGGRTELLTYTGVLALLR